MKDFDYNSREEWEALHKAQLIKAAAQAAAVAIGILLCALITLLTGCKSHKTLATETKQTETIVSAHNATDSTRTTTAWHSQTADTASAHTWSTIEFADSGGTLTLTPTGTLTLTGARRIRTASKASHASRAVTTKATDSTAVHAHNDTMAITRDTASTVRQSAPTASSSTSLLSRILRAVGLITVIGLIAYVWHWRRK